MRHTIIRSSARAAPASTGVAAGQRVGSLIGGIFGLLYVEANAGLLPGPWAGVLQIAAGVAFAGLAVLLVLARGPRLSARPAAGGGFRCGTGWSSPAKRPPSWPERRFLTDRQGFPAPWWPGCQ